MTAPQDILIVTGLSGAGKSTVLKTLEDLGWETVDNLPLALLDRLLARWRGPVILDADALNHFAGRTTALAERLGGRPALLTPHPLEFARLAGESSGTVLARRFDIGRDFAARVGATVLLKGTPTVVSGATLRHVVASGTPALATAGTGDVLSGLIGALLAKGMEAFEAAALGALAHVLAARAAAERVGPDHVMAGDVIESLPHGLTLR